MECDVPPKERSYRMSPAELREVEVHAQDFLAKGKIRPSKSPYGAGFYLYARRMVPCACEYTTGNSTTLRGQTVHRYHGTMNYSTCYMGVIISVRWTYIIRVISKFEFKSATYIRHHPDIITDCWSITLYPLDSATPQLDSER
jgi:hypothetical protein